MQTNLQAEVWSQTNCPACLEAKNLLKSKGFNVNEKQIGINAQYTKKDLIDKVPNARTIPQIFVGDEYIGGLPELKRYLLKHDNNKTTKVV